VDLKEAQEIAKEVRGWADKDPLSFDDLYVHAIVALDDQVAKLEAEVERLKKTLAEAEDIIRIGV